MSELSVIIPIYNKEKYIRAALRSVLEQPFRDLELIAVNDGSTDECLSILRDMAEVDKRIRVVDIPNGGVSNARNIGLFHAKGQWIQFLDADDMLDADYLPRAMQVLKEHPVDILFSGFTMVDEHMNPVKEVGLPETGIRNQEELCRCFIDYQYSNGFFGYISNKLFKRSLWEKSGAQFPVGTTLAEDLDFYARMYPMVENAYFWDGNSFLYRQTEANYTNNTTIDYYSQIKVQLDIRAWFQKSGLHSTYLDCLDGHVAQYAAYILFYDNEEKKDLSHAFTFLRENAEIMACIHPGYMNGFNRAILFFLQKGNLWGIRLLYAARNGLRSLYRRAKKNG